MAGETYSSAPLIPIKPRRTAGCKPRTRHSLQVWQAWQAFSPMRCSRNRHFLAVPDLKSISTAPVFCFFCFFLSAARVTADTLAPCRIASRSETNTNATERKLTSSAPNSPNSKVCSPPNYNASTTAKLYNLFLFFN